jgi:VanZ family protein
MGVIFYFSSRSRITVSPQYVLNFLFFKSLHVIEYAVLYIFYVRALKNTTTIPNKQSYVIAFLFLLLYASSDEYHQTFVATREGAPRDVIIDLLGASLVWIYLQKLLPQAPKKLKILAGRLGV